MSAQDPWAQYATPTDEDPWAKYATPVSPSGPSLQQRQAAAKKTFEASTPKAVSPLSYYAGRASDILGDTAPGAMKENLSLMPGAIAAPGVGNYEGLAAGIIKSPLVQLPRNLLNSLTTPDKLMLRAATTKQLGEEEVPASFGNVRGVVRWLNKMTGPTRVRAEEALARYMSTKDVPVEGPLSGGFRAPAQPSPEIAMQSPPVNGPGPLSDVRQPSSPSGPIEAPNLPQLTSPNPAIRLAQNITPIAGRPVKAAVFAANRLAQVAPELTSMQRGPAFEQALLQGYQKAGEAIQGAEAQVPAGTLVPKAPIRSAWNALKDDYEARGLTASARSVDGMLEKLKATGSADAMSWDDFVTLKRTWFPYGTKRAGVLRQAYEPFISATRGISPALDQANTASSVFRQALDAGQLDLQTGVRMR